MTPTESWPYYVPEQNRHSLEKFEDLYLMCTALEGKFPRPADLGLPPPRQHWENVLRAHGAGLVQTEELRGFALPSAASRLAELGASDATSTASGEDYLMHPYAFHLIRRLAEAAASATPSEPGPTLLAPTSSPATSYSAPTEAIADRTRARLQAQVTPTSASSLHATATPSSSSISPVQLLDSTWLFHTHKASMGKSKRMVDACRVAGNKRPGNKSAHEIVSMIEFQLQGIDPDHLSRAAMYCDAVLRDQPFRRTAYCLVTDLEHVQLVWRTRTPHGEADIEGFCTTSMTLEEGGWGQLLFVMFASQSQLGRMREIAVQGKRCHPTRRLGSGATSEAYACLYDDSQDMVLKKARHQRYFPALANEIQILRILARYAITSRLQTSAHANAEVVARAKTF